MSKRSEQRDVKNRESFNCILKKWPEKSMRFIRLTGYFDNCSIFFPKVSSTVKMWSDYFVLFIYVPNLRLIEFISIFLENDVSLSSVKRSRKKAWLGRPPLNMHENKLQKQYASKDQRYTSFIGVQYTLTSDDLYRNRWISSNKIEGSQNANPIKRETTPQNQTHLSSQ